MNLIVLLLGLLTAFGPLSIDMYLPALPSIAEEFGSDLSRVQFSLASFLIGIAAGQIFYGPFSDKFGRKRPLYFGLILYCLASFLCARASNVEALIFYRFLQALGACAGIVISRATVRDLYRPHESAKVFSLLMLIMGVAPILAPIFGGFFTTIWGWRSIFWVLTIISATTLLLIHFLLKETHTPDPEYRISQSLGHYFEILKDRTFTGHTLSLSFVYSGMFAYITGSSFVFIRYYNLTPSQYSWVFGINAFGLILFSQVNARLLRNHPPEKIIRRALPFTALTGALIFVVGLLKAPVWAMCIALFLFMVSMGLVVPNAAATALSNQKKFAGSASALMGTIQFGVAAFSSSLVSRLHNGTLLPMTAVIFSCALLSLLMNKVLVAREN